MMKWKPWLKYLFILTAILCVTYSGNIVLSNTLKDAAKNYYHQPILLNTLMILFFGGIGLLLGLERLINETKKEGRWKIDIPKLILLGIPSLYFSLAYSIYFSDIGYTSQILVYPIHALFTKASGMSFISIFGLIFGYTLITSLYKDISK